MSLRQATHIVLSRWRVVLAGVALVMAAALAQVFLTVPVYTASTQVYLSSTTRAAETGSYVLTDTDLERYVDVLVSPSVQAPLRRALGLPPTAPPISRVAARVTWPRGALTPATVDSKWTRSPDMSFHLRVPF